MKRTAFIQTYTGEKFWPLEPKAEDVRIEDIAHALSHLCRFAGHVEAFYSVAQHAVLVSRYCEPQDAFWGLMHDSTEAYMVDVPSPVKRDPRFAFYRMAERKLMGEICKAFDLPQAEPKSVSVADRVVLSMEARDLLKPTLSKEYWIPKFGDPPAERITPWSPRVAKARFLARFSELRRDQLEVA